MKGWRSPPDGSTEANIAVDGIAPIGNGLLMGRVGPPTADVRARASSTSASMSSVTPSVDGDGSAPFVQSPPAPVHRSLDHRHIGTIVWVLLCAIALFILDRLHAPRTFYYDEWSVVLGRRTGGIETLLMSHNGHLSLVPASIFRAFFDTFGLDHYHPYRLAGLLVHVGVASLVFMYVRDATR